MLHFFFPFLKNLYLIIYYQLCSHMIVEEILHCFQTLPALVCHEYTWLSQVDGSPSWHQCSKQGKTLIWSEGLLNSDVLVPRQRFESYLATFFGWRKRLVSSMEVKAAKRSHLSTSYLKEKWASGCHPKKTSHHLRLLLHSPYFKNTTFLWTELMLIK